MDYRDWGRGDFARHERRSTDSWSDDSRDPILGGAYPPVEEEPRPVGRRYRHDDASPAGTDPYGDVEDDGLIPSGPYAPATPAFHSPSRRRGADPDDADRYIPDWASGPAHGRAAVAEPTAEVSTIRTGRHRGPDPTAAPDTVFASRPAFRDRSDESRGDDTDLPDKPTGRAGRRAIERGATEQQPIPRAGRGRRRRADDEEAEAAPASGRAVVLPPADVPPPAEIPVQRTRRGRRRAVEDDPAPGADGRPGRFIDSRSWETSAERPLADSDEIAQWIRSPDPDRRRGGPGDVDRWWDRATDPEEWARPAREWLTRDQPDRGRASRARSERGTPSGDRPERDRPQRDRPEPSGLELDRPGRPGATPRSRRAASTGRAIDTETDRPGRDLGRAAARRRGFDRDISDPPETTRAGRSWERAEAARDLESRWENETSTFFRDPELFRDPDPARDPDRVRDRDRDSKPTRWGSEPGPSSRQTRAGRRAADAGQRDTGGTLYGGTPEADEPGPSDYRDTTARSGGTLYGAPERDPRGADDFTGRPGGDASGGLTTGGRATETRSWDRFTDTGQWDRFTDTTEWDRSELTRIDPEALGDRYWPDREENFWPGTRLAGDDPRWVDTPTSAPRSPAVAYPLPEPPVRDRPVGPSPVGPSRGVRPDTDPRAPRSGGPTRSGVPTYARSDTAPYGRAGTTTWAARPASSARREFGASTAGRSRRLQDDLLDPNPGGPFLAVLYAAAWYAVPVLVFLVWLLTLDTSVPPGCVTDVTGGGCDSERARAMEVVVAAAPRFGTALASSLVCAVVLRWWGSTWRAGSVGLSAAVVGGGVSTVLLSIISGQPIGG